MQAAKQFGTAQTGLPAVTGGFYTPAKLEMSLAEILAELPKLLVAERQAVHDELVKLGTFDEDLQFCSEAAAIGAQLLDKLEDEDARSRMG